MTHRFLHVQSCLLPCHLCLCTTSLPSAPSPARRSPLLLLCRALPPLHLMGSISSRCRPPPTRDSCPLTIKALAGVQFPQDFLRLTPRDSRLKEADWENYDRCEPLRLPPNNNLADRMRKATRRRKWRSRWCDRRARRVDHVAQKRTEADLEAASVRCSELMRGVNEAMRS